MLTGASAGILGARARARTHEASAVKLGASTSMFARVRTRPRAHSLTHIKQVLAGGRGLGTFDNGFKVAHTKTLTHNR